MYAAEQARFDEAVDAIRGEQVDAATLESAAAAVKAAR